MAQNLDLLLISVDSPVLMGIYENCRLIKSFSAEGKFSDSLPKLFAEVLDFGAESSVDSATPSPLSLDSFSQKGCTPHPAPPNFFKMCSQKLPLFAFRGRASLSPLLAKNQRSYYCSLESDFLHHEAGEFSGASHKLDLDSANLENSQNLVQNKSREAQPLKSVVGGGGGSCEGGGGERLRNSQESLHSSPRPLPQKNARGEKGDSNADLSAQGRKKNRDSSPTAQNDNLSESAESALDSASRRISNIFYANGPGNFSAIKLTHIFLQTISIVKNIPLFCADAFHFSDNEFINAYGKVHFHKKGGEIRTTTLDSKHPNSFSLPQSLDLRIFSEDCAPLYILPAV